MKKLLCFVALAFAFSSAEAKWVKKAGPRQGNWQFEAIDEEWALGKGEGAENKKAYHWENGKWVKKAGPGQENWKFQDIGNGWAIGKSGGMKRFAYKWNGKKWEYKPQDASLYFSRIGGDGWALGKYNNYIYHWYKKDGSYKWWHMFDSRTSEVSTRTKLFKWLDVGNSWAISAKVQPPFAQDIKERLRAFEWQSTEWKAYEWASRSKKIAFSKIGDGCALAGWGNLAGKAFFFDADKKVWKQIGDGKFGDIGGKGWAIGNSNGVEDGKVYHWE